MHYQTLKIVIFYFCIQYPKVPVNDVTEVTFNKLLKKPKTTAQNNSISDQSDNERKLWSSIGNEILNRR